MRRHVLRAQCVFVTILFVIILLILERNFQRNCDIRRHNSPTFSDGQKINDSVQNFSKSNELFEKDLKSPAGGYYPQYRYGMAKNNPYMLIAIPSVMRKGESYLSKTLRYMVDPLTETQKQNTVFVIYLADDKLSIFENQTKRLYAEFREEFDRGIIEVIGPPRELYPNWESNLVPNFGDKMEQIRWRSKQNLDMAFLMSYTIRYLDPTYFLMMEDDVQATRNYMNEILKFAESGPAKTWEYCSFTKVGGAGKLFHHKSAKEFAQFVAIFWDSKPLDWLYWDFVRNKRCGYNESQDSCKEKSNKLIRTYPGDLFVHLGKVSSKTSVDNNHKIDSEKPKSPE